MYLPEGANVAVSVDDMTALNKMLVSLGVIKTTDYRPNGGDWCIDGLDHHGAALVGPH